MIGELMRNHRVLKCAVPAKRCWFELWRAMLETEGMLRGDAFGRTWTGLDGLLGIGVVRGVGARLCGSWSRLSLFGLFGF